MPAKRGKREPWPHICQDCGAEYMSAGYNAEACPECKKRRHKEACRRYRLTDHGRETLKASLAAWRASHREQYLETQRRWRENHRERVRLLDRLGRHARNGDRQALFERGRLTGKLKSCARLSLQAFDLPCGQRPECWWGRPCEKTEGMKKPRSAALKF